MELVIRNLTKQYPNKLAVDGVNLTLRPGVYGLLGANGAGKTTLMRMLCGILHPTGGGITLDGLTVDQEDYRASLGYLPQDFGYYPGFTGMDFLLYLGALKGLPRPQAKARAAELLDLVGLSEVAKRKLKTYSGGMKQRLGIAMALARFPRLLILDEPTNGLDPAGIEEIRELITEMPGRYGITVMISSHLLGEIDQMATAVGIIKGGELIFQDSMEQLNLRRRPYLLLRTGDDRAAAQVLQPLRPKWLPHGVALENPADGLAAQAVEALVQSGIPIYRVEERQRSLEDVFLELTGKELSL